MTWLFANKIGRWILGCAGIALGFVIALFKAFSAGKKATRLEQQKQILEAVKERKKSDEAIDRMSASDRRQRLSDRWGQ